ncbi:flagellar hook-basal body complex protein FliE [Thalassorhabdus alkalitolerans]|uniref:Flagellar hook-basal body complex protein FliE n=1 Tax=Thalassorhabdus alkalitolerans TaxID=2282697 RepID=A0ABW0YKH3_9BACI|nr:flagellar hook-basal body complex protein FliE [Thalassobacillus sp. C254]
MELYSIGDSRTLDNMQTKKTPAEAHQSFKESFTHALSQVNETMKESDKMTEKLAAGKAENLHDVMIAAQKSSISLQATVEVRNKVIEAYQEVMRMQV